MVKKKDSTYNVKYVDHTFFLLINKTKKNTWRCKSRYITIAVYYTIDGVFYKLEHTDTYWRFPPQRLRNVHINLEMKKRQNNPLLKQ